MQQHSHFKPRRRFRQKGVTLVEMMIAIMLGIIMTTAASQFFIGTNQAIALGDSLATNQETGGFALDIISSHIINGGYSEVVAGDTVPPLMIKSKNINCGPGTLCAADNLNVTGVKGDRLSVPFRGAGDNSMTDCTGQIVSADLLVANVFWVEATDITDAANTSGTLFCQAVNLDDNSPRSVAPVPILDNVEAMHVLIGVASDKENTSVARFITIDKVKDTELVRAIRFGFIVNSQDRERPNVRTVKKETRSYVLLDEDLGSRTDGNMRQIYSTTVALANFN